MKIFKLFFVLLYFLLFSEVSFTKSFIPVEVFSIVATKIFKTDFAQQLQEKLISLSLDF